ncbi:MAG TPA: NAD(P)H-binding protein [Gaiellales bacterium]|jgi:uncharacterized protein YbjT (DUF2867 family)
MGTRRRFAVVGATGRVGRHVVDVLTERGHDVVAIARSTGVDVISGDGLADSLSGVEGVVDAATGPSRERGRATEFFTAAARNLHAAGQHAGVQRIVAVSMIGADRLEGGYGAAKLAHERAILEGPVTARILRAAQLHELVGQLTDRGRRGHVAYVPRARTQLVSARAVGEALAAIACGSPSAIGYTPSGLYEIAGPREESLVDAAILLAARRGDPVEIAGTDNPDDPDSQVYRSGGLLPNPGAILAGPTFEEWLVTHA